MSAETVRTQGNFIIPYVFDKNVDRVRRDAFVEATKAWEVRAARRPSMGVSFLWLSFVLSRVIPGRYHSLYASVRIESQ